MSYAIRVLRIYIVMSAAARAAGPLRQAFQTVLRETPLGLFFFSQVAQPRAVRNVLREARRPRWPPNQREPPAAPERPDARSSPGFRVPGLTFGFGTRPPLSFARPLRIFLWCFNQLRRC